MSPYDYYKDLPHTLTEITESPANVSTPVVDWNTKDFGCQISALWYNSRIDSKERK